MAFPKDLHVLGPLLFLLCINDIENCSEFVSIILFADDTNILYSHTCLKTLNTIIHSAGAWNWIKLRIGLVSTNSLSMPQKLNLSFPDQEIEDIINISINNENIRQEKCLYVTFLGIFIDEFLTWGNHLNFMKKKLIKRAAIISRIRHFTTPNTLKLIYYVLVYPYLIYGNYIWGNAYKSRIEKVKKIQKNIVRLMTFKSYSEHAESIFQELQILNIYKVNDYLISKFIIRYFHLKNLPEIFPNCFLANKEIHNYITRSTSSLHKRCNKKNYSYQTFSCQ